MCVSGQTDSVLLSKVIHVYAEANDVDPQCEHPTKVMYTDDGYVPGLHPEAPLREFPSQGLICKRVGTYIISVRAFRQGCHPSETRSITVVVSPDEERRQREGSAVEAYPATVFDMNEPQAAMHHSEVRQNDHIS